MSRRDRRAPSTALRALKTAFAAPNLAVAAVLTHHVIDAAIAQRNTVWPFFQQHPWFLFTAAITLALCAAHVALFAARVWWRDGGGANPNDRHLRLLHRRLRQWDLCLFGLDGAWAALWVLQLTVQAALPAEHRAYQLDTVVVMMALYVVQALLTVPLVYYLFCAYKDEVFHAAVGAAADTAPLYPAGEPAETTSL